MSWQGQARFPADAQRRAQAIRLAIFDIDGVLTDGRLWYGAQGEELKAFHVHDGLGLKQLMAQGIEVAVISGRKGAATESRLNELGIRYQLLGRGDKGAALDELLAETGHQAETSAYMGDDWPDLVPMQRVGLAVATADARPEVRAQAHWTTERPGGAGAARDLCDLLLMVRGLLPVVEHKS